MEPADRVAWTDWQRRTTEGAAAVAEFMTEGHTATAYEHLLMLRADLAAALQRAESMNPDLAAVRQADDRWREHA